MRYSRLASAAIVAVLLGATALMPMAYASGDESVQQVNGVSYVSGGVGEASIARLTSLAPNFNLKLVFALTSGAYLSDIKVTISDKTGKTLLDTTSAGPWFLTKLPAGNYQIVASFAGKLEKRSATIAAESLKTVDFRWRAE